MSNLRLAKEREAKKLRQHNLDEDGNPLENLQEMQDEAQNEHDSGGDDSGYDEDRVAELERQLQALHGRLAPAQRDTEQYRRLYQEEQALRQRELEDRQREIEALREQLEENNNQIDLTEILTDEEREEYDEHLINVIQKVADSVAKRRMPKINARAEALRALEEREAALVDAHRKQVLVDRSRGLHQLSELAYDPEFRKWSREGDNDIESVVNSLLKATSTDEVDRYAKIVSRRIAAYNSRNKTQTPTDPRPSLGNQMRRNPQQRMSDAEVKQKLNEAKNLARSRNPADRKRAQEIINEVS